MTTEYIETVFSVVPLALVRGLIPLIGFRVLYLLFRRYVGRAAGE